MLVESAIQEYAYLKGAKEILLSIAKDQENESRIS
jgi:hypothetical protein